MATIAYLHGMGGARAGWQDALAPGLAGDVSADLIALDYADLLVEATDEFQTRRAGLEAHESTAREKSDYRARQQLIAQQLAEVEEPWSMRFAWPDFLPHPRLLPDVIPLPRLLRTSLFGLDQVGRYLDEPMRREAIISRVTQSLTQASDPLVIVAHSMGTLVALDAICRSAVKVNLLITLASPLGHSAVAAHMPVEAFPYGRVGGWLNLVHPLDPVPFGRGIAERFPAAHDVMLPITAGLLPDVAVRAVTAHLESTYLSSRTVQEAVRLGLRSGDASVQVAS